MAVYTIDCNLYHASLVTVMKLNLDIRYASCESIRDSEFS